MVTLKNMDFVRIKDQRGKWDAASAKSPLHQGERVVGKNPIDWTKLEAGERRCQKRVEYELPERKAPQ